MSHLPIEPEFEQAYKELAFSLENSTLFEKHPEYRKALQVASIPERTIQFRVTWENDKGELEVNRGYRVQFNSALGPYKGGLRFHPTVNMSILKFLGFEQIFKNALTGLNMGGGKGGADFDPKGKSDNEIRKFCSAFMMELSKHIGADIDVPAGDIGVGGREIGFLFGAYKRQRHIWEGVLTGKGLSWGGSLIRPEATGYGLVYYVQHMIEYATNGQESFKGKRVAISGSGNVAQYAALKVIEFGGTVISLSDSKGALVIRNEGDSITPQEIYEIQQLKDQRPMRVHRRSPALVARRPSGCGPPMRHPERSVWTRSSGADRERMQVHRRRFQHGLHARRHRALRSPPPTAQESGAVWYAPGKAANAGGVAVSGLEMAQNSQRLTWTAEEVDQKLKNIMKVCFETGVRTSETYTALSEGQLPSLVIGSNIAGFIKVAEAMRDHGDWF
uniref:Glutamate dehydrogenase n=1 Tax=Coccidioides posadasii RMSCC 3488 TaxID=454284 RepID=A0A0J6FW43_COCPO|nr:NADP-specific glutamate dehydrogenase [Coccidioides posadasii RMSCC 3488]